MHAYGNDRKDNLTCRWGCCGSKYAKLKKHGNRLGNVIVRRGRKKARQLERKLLNEES